jgi:hypothetical protein
VAERLPQMLLVRRESQSQARHTVHVLFVPLAAHNVSSPAQAAKLCVFLRPSRYM